jgi:hypothetical protein
MQGKVEPIYNGWFNSEAGVWYLVRRERRHQVRSCSSAGRRPRPRSSGPGSQIYFDRKEYQIGQDARYEASYTHPQLMIRVEPS